MTKEIICASGHKVIVDDEDYPLLSRHSWYYPENPTVPRTYAVTIINVRETSAKRTIAMHNMIIGFATQIDHVDGDTKNNTKKNLRRATYQQNGWNKGATKSVHGRPRSSKYKGVIYAPRNGIPRWLVAIRHVEQGAHKSTGKTIRVGYFFDEIEAAKAYNKKIRELRGEWAWLNPLPPDAP